MAELTDTFSDLPTWQKQLILIGAAMGSSKRGIQQILNQAGVKNKALGTTDVDIEDIKFSQKAIDRLAEATPAAWAGEIIGSLADPIGMLAGGGAAKVPLKLAGRLALGGGLSGALSEVREEGSRLGQAGMGAGLGLIQSKLPNISKRDLLYYGDKAVLSPQEREIFENPAAFQKAKKLGQAFKGFVDPTHREDVNPIRGVLDDTQAVIDFGKVNRPGWLLGDLYHLPELYKKYPGLADSEAFFRIDPRVPGGGTGAFWPGSGRIHVEANSLKELVDGVTHEITHSIQNQQPGWPAGSNTQSIKKGLEHILGAMRKFEPDEQWTQTVGALTDAINDPKSRGIFKAYFSDAGEMEARDAAHRAVLGMHRVTNPYAFQGDWIRKRKLVSPEHYPFSVEDIKGFRDNPFMQERLENFDWEWLSSPEFRKIITP